MCVQPPAGPPLPVASRLGRGSPLPQKPEPSRRTCQRSWGWLRIRARITHKPKLCPGSMASIKVYLTGRADAPAIPLKTGCSLGSGGQSFSGRLGRPLAEVSGHKGLDRLAALHQAFGPIRFSGQPIPCDRALHVSRTYPVSLAPQTPIPDHLGVRGPVVSNLVSISLSSGMENGFCRLGRPS